MRKLKSYSFYFIAIIFFASGFLFSTAHASTTIDTDIIIDTTWTKDGSPYFVTSEITVAEGATLTISAGVVVKLKNSLIIDGKIDAEGTVDLPIYFTSFYDTQGGNTYESCYYENYEEDGITPIGEKNCETITEEGEPRVGDWGDIFIESGAEQSILNNVVMHYSSDGIYLYNGASLISTNYDSDQGVSVIGSEGSFDNLKATFLYIQNSSNVTLLNSKIKGVDNDDVVYIFDNSTAVFENVEISNEESEWPSGTGVYVFGNSSLDIRKSSISKINDGLQIFRGSTLQAEDLSIECTDTGISMSEDSNLNFSGGSVSCLNDGLSLHDNVKADISGVKITDALDAGIFAYNNTDGTPITITKSEITGNNYGFLVFGTNFSAHENSIHDNLSNGALTHTLSVPEGETPPVYNLDFASNYWGDPSGPTHTTSPDGIGDEVSNGILYSPFLKSDPLIPIIPTKNPVIIVPGAMGTELIRDYGDKDEIWPAISKVIFSLSDNYLRDLELLPNGDENLDFPMKVGDIIRDIPSVDIFNGLVSELETNGGYVEDKDLFVFPYDWRLSSTKNAELLKEKIDKVISDSGSEKVDIVAHSMGGLLAKEYIKENGEDKIDHLVFLGTPHLGAPKAYKALVYGDNMGFEKFYIPFLSSNIVKVISQNMPSNYELLPSRKYVSDLRYISEKTIGSDSVYLDYDATKNLLIEKETNQALLESADTFHQNIDDLDLSGIKVSNFSACGEATLSAINVRKKASIGPIVMKEDYKLAYANGDSTVPLDSSLGISDVNKYFVDKVSHSALPSSPDVPSVVRNILEDKIPQVGTKVFEDVINCTPIHGYILSIHSPISLDIYDTNGNHSGLDADGNIENNIEGVSYDTIGEAKFAFIPDGLSVKVKGSATGSGTFDLAIEKVVNGETTETKFWNDVPITSTSQMNFDFNSYDKTNTIEIDNKGSKANIPSSNTLSEGEDYLAVPANITETRKQSSSGSYIKNNQKLVLNIPNTEIKQEIPSDIKKVSVEKPVIIKKSLVKVIEKKVTINKETIMPTSNLGASVINAGHNLDLWGTIKSFFRWLFHIKK